MRAAQAAFDDASQRASTLADAIAGGMSDLFKTNRRAIRTLGAWLLASTSSVSSSPTWPRRSAFYRRLGLDLPADADAAPHVEVALPGGLRLAFDTEETIRSFDDSWTAAGGRRAPGRARVRVRRPRRRRRDLRRSSTGSGSPGHLAPWDAFWGQRYAIVLDPDGNHVELFAPLPVS